MPYKELALNIQLSEGEQAIFARLGRNKDGLSSCPSVDVRLLINFPSVGSRAGIARPCFGARPPSMLGQLDFASEAEGGER